MSPASKTLRNTGSSRIGQVDAVVKLKPKKMVKEEMTGGNREQGRKKMDNILDKLKINMG